MNSQGKKIQKSIEVSLLKKKKEKRIYIIKNLISNLIYK
jgi:hypothetical protein